MFGVPFVFTRGTLAYIMHTNLVDTLACTKSCLNQTYSSYYNRFMFSCVLTSQLHQLKSKS